MRSTLAKTGRIAGIGIVTDQVTKALARLLPLCATSSIDCDKVGIGGPVELIRVHNAGGAWGFLQDLWVWTPLAFVALGLTLLAILGRSSTSALTVGLGIQIGGALGNLADRVLLGGVTDFIYLGFGPIFNLADVMLVVGSVMATRQLVRVTGEAPVPQLSSTPSADTRGGR